MPVDGKEGGTEVSDDATDGVKDEDEEEGDVVVDGLVRVGLGLGEPVSTALVGDSELVAVEAQPPKVTPKARASTAACARFIMGILGVIVGLLASPS